MNVIRYMFLSVCALTLLIALATAQNPAPKTQSAQNNTSSVGVQKSVTGTISGINRLKATITVNYRGVDHLIGVTVKTGIFGGEGKIRYTDLKKGDNVTVEYLRKIENKIHAELIVNNSYKSPVLKQVMKQQQKVTPRAKPVERQPEPVVSGNRKMMVGTLTAVDVNRGTITVRLRGNDYTIGTTKKTIIYASEGSLSLKDCKKGDVVTVYYLKNRNGTRSALQIINRTYKISSS